MQSLTWYLNRLSLMSPAEVMWRFSQAVGERVGALRPAKPVPRPDCARIELPEWPSPPGVDSSRYIAAAERIIAGEVELYGRWTAVGSPVVDWNRDPVSGIVAPPVPGKRLDYRDARLVGSARNIWELNRHFQLVMLAQAWACTGDQRYRAAAIGLIESWIDACPYPLGINWASALEHGIRLINWYLAARLLALSPGEVQAVSGWLDSVHRHCEFIWKNPSRHSSANNHLIGETAGLYVASTVWPCWPESARWRAQAKVILEREAVTQVHADGVTREQTVGYQMFVLQLLIIAGLVGEGHKDPFSEGYWRVVYRMLVFLNSIRDSRGNLPAFGDSDEGVIFLLSPDGRARRLDDLLALGSAWSAADEAPILGQDSSASWLLSGFPAPSAWPGEPLKRESWFRDGGYYVLRGSGPAEATLIFDAGPLGYLSIAAHGHADCLSITLSIAGEPILIDPGTYCYHEDSAWRDYFRSTRAHNTLCVDGMDQSQMAGPFMWLRQAQATVELLQESGGRQRVRARHDGYMRLKDPVMHAREVVMHADGRQADIADRVQARGAHTLERFFHFGETCSVHIMSAQVVKVLTGRVTATLVFDPGTELRLYRGELQGRSGWISPSYAQLRETYTLCASHRRRGPATLSTTIRWMVDELDSKASYTISVG